jgi:hypothetical protein
MRHHTRRIFRRTRVFAALSLTLALLVPGLSFSVFAADDPVVASATLPGGTSLSVQIDSPADNASVPFGSLTLSGAASIGEADPEPNTLLVYTVDLSGSTQNRPVGSQCPDLNGDGVAGTILDCEIQALLALNDAAVASGVVGEVGVVGFAGIGPAAGTPNDAAIADVSPDIGVQVLTSPDAQSFSGQRDIDRVLRSARYSPQGGFNLFTSVNVGGVTNYYEAVVKSIAVADASDMETKIVAFVTDGVPNRGPNRSALLSLLATAANKGITFYTFSIGFANCDFMTFYGALSDISTETGGTCTNVEDINELADILPDLIDANLTQLAVSVNGDAPVAMPAADLGAPLPAIGPATVSFSTTIVGLQPGVHEICAIATGTDPQEGSAQACVSVTVFDDEDPVLDLPDDVQTATDPGSNTAVVTFSATATDNVDGDIPVTCVPVSGATFALGPTEVECSATDSSGNTATGSFVITVVDEEGPVLTLPDDFSVPTDAGVSTAVVSFAATATDNVDGNVSVTCDPPPGATFGLGDTTVECSASDSTGNATSGSFVVTVVDEEPPILHLPDDITALAEGSGTTAVVNFIATATDNVDGSVPVTCVPASGSTFNEGPTTVECSATDAAGNTESGEFSVTVVVDNVAPVTTASIDPGANAAGWHKGDVTIELSAEDNPGGSGVQSITTELSGAQSGGGVTPGDSATEAITTEGITTVRYFATDHAGNVEQEQLLTIRLDKTPPTIWATLTSGGNTYVPGEWTNQPVTVTFHCSDDGSGVKSFSAPETLNDGAGQSVSGSCEDNAGNVAELTVEDINVDLAELACTCELSPGSIWPPNNQMVNVSATVTISAGISPAQFVLLSVTSNEPDQVNPGDPANDIQDFETGTPDTEGQVRAQRLGSGTGRVYTFTYDVSNAAGSSATCSGTVVVPHNQGNAQNRQ